LSHLFNSGSNHITGWNALKKLPKPLLETLQWMGFRFDGKFDPKNGAKGKIPVSPDEWSRVGINSDARAMSLLKFLYRMLQFSQYLHLSVALLALYFDNNFGLPSNRFCSTTPKTISSLRSCTTLGTDCYNWRRLTVLMVVTAILKAPTRFEHGVALVQNLLGDEQIPIPRYTLLLLVWML
jgi:hypothetical protein